MTLRRFSLHRSSLRRSWLRQSTIVLVVAGVGAIAAAAPAAAQDFYRGKTITIMVGFSPGGGFDLNARVLARHIGRHIPGNPIVVIQNMPGAGSMTAVHYLDLTASKDGTYLDIFNFGNIGDSKLNPDKVKADFRKYNWIGSISQDLTVCYVWHAFGVKTLADLKAKPKVHMGLTGMGTSSDTNQRILKNVFGVKVQQVAGYPGSAEQRIAVERGELDGDCGAWSSLPQEWVDGKKVVAVIKSGSLTAPDMPPEVPYSVDIAPSERDRQVLRMLLASAQVGRPFIASQAVPAERIRILRDGFNATMKDPQFIAELEKLRLPISPKTGEEALQVVEGIYATPDDIVAAARKVASE
jgi:tripartite-type tricarboxylate transporter receptor subunit TctC